MAHANTKALQSWQVGAELSALLSGAGNAFHSFVDLPGFATVQASNQGEGAQISAGAG